MGAEIATLYAAVTPIPTHVVAVMPAHSAIAIWHEGVLGDVSDWNYLATVMSLIIEAPSYGKRRRHNRQVRGAQVHRVADLVVGGLVQITESIALLTWMESYVPAHSKSNFG